VIKSVLKFKRRSTSLLCLAWFGLLWVPHYASAEGVFLQHRVYDPLNLLGAIPALSVPAGERFRVQISATHANVFAGGRSTNANRDETLVMDGELSEIDLRAQWRIGQCFAAAVDGRMVSHTPGLFDAFISEWHQAFGFPNANRQEIPDNQLGHFFSTDGTDEQPNAEFSATHTQIQTAGAALGDLWFSVQRATKCRGSAFANGTNESTGHWRLGLKVPTGDVRRWTSGGQWALFADWHSGSYAVSSKTRLTTSIGASFSSEWDDRFESLSPRPLIAYGAVMMDYRINSRWQALLQVEGRSAIFNSQLTELGEAGAQLHVGVRAALNLKQRIELSFSEDLFIDTAPDIGVRFAFSQRF